jgi:putative Ca2+/H+ antiporter (TMEM165/GDT1 family)
MSAFYFAFLAVLLAGLGSRDQLTVAAMTLRQGQRPALLIVGVIASVATAAAAAWAAGEVAPLLAPRARLVMAALALGLAGGEALVSFAPRRPREPTASLGALALLLLAHQLTDAARFLVFAIAVAQAAPLPAGIGGAAGGAAMLAAGWMAPAAFVHPRLLLARRTVGALLLLVALVVGFSAWTR